MNQLKVAEKYGITHEQLCSIDAWFLQSPIPLKEFDLNKSLPFMSAKLNLSEAKTLELLQNRRDAVIRSTRLMKIIKGVIIFSIGYGIASLIF